MENKTEVTTLYGTGEVKKKTHMLNGIPHGIEEWFYPDGRPWGVTTFVMGICHGLWTAIDQHGNTLSKGLYRNGKEHGPWTVNNTTDED